MEPNPDIYGVDLFPKASKEESGIPMQTWYGFEVVLPDALVSPDPNYTQTAPDALGPQSRRVQSPARRGDHRAEENTINSGTHGGVTEPDRPGNQSIVEALRAGIIATAFTYFTGVLNRSI